MKCFALVLIFFMIYLKDYSSHDLCNNGNKSKVSKPKHFKTVFIGLGYHRDPQTRAAFMEVLTKILQQGTEFETLAETALADRFERLVELVTMIGDKGELPIAMALASVVATPHMDELARVFVNLFDAKHLLYQLLWNMFSKEVICAAKAQFICD